MNSSNNLSSNISFSSYTDTSRHPHPSRQKTPLQNSTFEVQQPIRIPVPEALKELGKKIGINEEIPPSLEKRQIIQMKTVEEVNEAYGSVLAKTQDLIKNWKGAIVSGEIKELDEEITLIEKYLVKNFEEGGWISIKLKEELKIGKDFHKLLWSLNEYLDFQRDFRKLDEQLDESLIQVNDSFLDDIHGLSSSAFSHVQKSIGQMKELIELALPFFKKKNSFTPDVLNQLSFTIHSATSTLSDWLFDFLSHGDSVISSGSRLWEQGLKKEGSDLEKWIRIKEAGELLLSFQKTLKEVKEVLPQLILAL